MTTKIVFFNHKGGVNKTTTSYNLGWMLASLDKKVLLVDADPQCTLSNLILGEGFEKYYIDDATKFQNIKDGVKVAFQGKLKPIEAVSCFSPAMNENLFLLAGHADLSEYDASLSLAQNSNNALTALQNLPGAFNELITKTAEKYNIDFVLIELNSGLSAINQNLFISSDAFIVPTNPDPFSVMALNTLSVILPRWVDWADRMRPLFEDTTYPLSNSRPKFIGEIIQIFNIRNGKPAKSFLNNINEIKKAVQDKFVPAIAKKQMLFASEAYQKAKIQDDFCLLELRNFQSLMNSAYSAEVPVFALASEQIKSSDETPITGIVLTNMEELRDSVKKEFEVLAHKIITLNEYAASI